MKLSLLTGEDARRDSRHKVLLRGKMRAGALPSEVCVRDVSRRGLLLQAAAPPRPGTIVEIIVAKRSIVGRVRWAKGRRFGMELSPPISVEAFLTPGSISTGLHTQRKPAPSRRHGQSRHQSAQIQFAAIVVAGAIALGWIGSLAYEGASQSSRTIASALDASS